jgi:hypothetical protein
MYQAAGVVQVANAIAHFITSGDPFLVSTGVLGLILFGTATVLLVVLAFRKVPEAN